MLPVLALIALAALPARAGDVLIFAAASLKTALEEIATAFEDTTGHRATLALAGSSTLARQIEQGAPAEVFISANEGWMDALEGGGLIAVESRFDLVSNTLVLIAPGADAPPVQIAPGFDLAGLVGDGRLAMALVDAVPAGIYGKAALESLGIWEAVRPKVAQADNVRAALALVAAGEAPFGIVYATDAIADPRVTVVGAFPPESHPPIVYPAARVSGRDGAAATAFMDFLKTDASRVVLTGQGFTVLGEE